MSLSRDIKPAFSPSLFKTIQNADVDELIKCTEQELRPILPCLVRMTLCAPIDTSTKWNRQKQKLLQIISAVETVNNLVALLSIDFHELELDAKKEQKLRSKLGVDQGDSILISRLTQSVALEFEKSDAARRLRLVLSELLAVHAQIKEGGGGNTFFEKKSELFESEAYLEEVSDVLCIAQAELPLLLPVSMLAEILLHISYGDWLLCRVLANTPDCFNEACTALIENSQSDDPDSKDSRQRTRTLCHLCKINPSQILNVRSLCVEHCKLPALAIELTLELKNEASDLITFVSGLLLGNDSNVRDWFAQFIRNGQKKKHDSVQILTELRAALLIQLHSLIPEESNELPEENVVTAGAVIRLYCALKGIASLKFSDEEVNELIRLVTSRPPSSAAAVRFVSLALCMLVACPHLMGSPEQERIVVDWIRWLLQQEAYFEKSTSSTSSFGELLVLIAIHFHSHHTHAIADLVCSVLGMKSVVKSNPLARVKSIFTQEVFTEQVITSYAVKVPVTSNLNAEMTGNLPAHCIHQLLKTRAFSRYKVPIKNWIYKQICQSKLPIHPIMLSLTEAFVNSVISVTSKVEYTNEPISEQEISLVFQDSFTLICTDDGDSRRQDIAPLILLLYYLLLHEDCITVNAKALTEKKKTVQKYSESLMAQLPIRYLLEQAQKEPHVYGGLFPPLLRLLATHYPHLCLVEDWLREDVTITTNMQPIAKMHVTSESLKDGYIHLQDCPTKLILQLEYLLSSSVADLMIHTEILVENLLLLLQEGVPRRVLDLVNKIWFRLNAVMPRKLRLMTVNALRQRRHGFHVMALVEEDVTIDPLNVLRCDERLFRCPPLFAISLHVLNSCLQMSKAYLSSHNSQQKFDPEKEELKNALIVAQDSAVIQMLLECCLPGPTEQGQLGGLSKLHETQRLICSHLHQMFIADPSLVKLVHFQGYPSELLPVTVGGIPSMHICIDFIPELLSQPHLEKQMFGVELTSYLCLQYALPKSMAVARLTVNVLSTMLGVLSSEVRTDYFLPLLPALVRICTAFPPLVNDVMSLLMNLGRVCSSHFAALGNESDTQLTSASYCSPSKPTARNATEMEERLETCTKYGKLNTEIQQTFSAIVKSAAMAGQRNEFKNT